MLPQVLFAILLGFVCADDTKNSKRSISSFGYPSWNSILGNSFPSHFLWQQNPFAHSSLYPMEMAYSGKGSHLGLGSTVHDIAAALAAAKEAATAAALAHHKVQAAREQVLIQERVAAAKEAAAHAAIQRSEAAAQVAAAIQKSEALVAAAAAAHKSAAARAASTASGPWTHSKPTFNHWV